MGLFPNFYQTAMVICDIADEETDEPVEVAPRQILKRQVERAKEAGYTVMGGSELEFYFLATIDDFKLTRKSTLLYVDLGGFEVGR